MKLSIEVDIVAKPFLPEGVPKEDYPTIAQMEESFKEALLSEIQGEMDVEGISVKIEEIVEQ